MLKSVASGLPAAFPPELTAGSPGSPLETLIKFSKKSLKARIGLMRDETAKRIDPGSLQPSSGVEKEAGDVAELYEFGPFRLEPAERRLSRNDEAVVLTPRAFDTLVLLVRKSGHLIEKDELIQPFGPTRL